MDKLGVLKKYFGFTEFRTGQEELVENILCRRDTLGIMPTGAGKSICYQLPALMFEGITLVISPLISLMKDQVNSLTQAGISAAYLNSSLNSAQYSRALQNAADGRYKIIYVAPERLQSEDFLSFVQKVEISMVTVDEAHCVSQWGQDFRPSYLKIARFIDTFAQRPVVSAFTATATAKVRDDITDKLTMENPYVLTTGFDRKNLHFAVYKPKDKLASLMSYLKGKDKQCGIVYCSTRKAVDEVCSSLTASGYNAARYHAGLSEQERRESQEAFTFDRCSIMVATNAFGMGIDKSNVSYVIHYNMPKNMESYYQEAGRAGRDGEPADCLLFYSGQDVITNQLLIDNTEVNEELDYATAAALKEKDYELLKRMTFYCHTNDCLREYILNYFGEKPSNFCGNCSNCSTNFEEADVTAEAQMILSCVKKSGERYGAKMIVDVLRGSRNQKLLAWRLDKLSTYGLIKGMAEQKLRDIIDYLVYCEYLVVTAGEYPIVKLGKNAADVLFNGTRVSMKVLRHYEDNSDRVGKKEKDSQDEGNADGSSADMGNMEKGRTEKGRTDKSRVDKVKSGKSKAADKNTGVDEELFERLRLLRSKIAAEQRVPAYIVFADAALKDMCIKMPVSSLEFLEVSGVGQTKLDRYGEAFIDEIKAYKAL